jgi:2-methylcitrate dehydratase PrpD
VFDAITRRLAALAASLPRPAVPERVRQAAASCLLDTLACGLAGMAEPSSQTVAAVISQEAHDGACSALGVDRPVSPRAAALINGSAAHALDFDDTHDEAVLHAGVSVIPAALAAAEAGGASGRALLDAVALGYDVQVRVALAATQAPGRSGWHYTSACGVFGAAAAAGRLMGLDDEAMADALGIALAQASGTLQSEDDGSWTKRLQPGVAAAAGVLAAQLAARGFRGPHEALEGRFGFYRVFFREVDPTPVLQGLGRRFAVERTSLKPFPTCRFTHAPAAALQDILRLHRVAPGDIDQIEVRVTGAAFAEVCEPLETKRRPRSRVHAQFSLPYALACIAHHGTVALADLVEEAVRRPELLALADRVRCLADPALDRRWGEKIGEAEVCVRRADGSVVGAHALPPGGPDRPLALAERLAKVRECAAWGAVGVSGDALIAAVEALDRAPDLAALSACLRQARPRPSP